jgi:hypothetical protein
LDQLAAVSWSDPQGSDKVIGTVRYSDQSLYFALVFGDGDEWKGDGGVFYGKIWSKRGSLVSSFCFQSNQLILNYRPHMYAFSTTLTVISRLELQTCFEIIFQGEAQSAPSLQQLQA